MSHFWVFLFSSIFYVCAAAQVVPSQVSASDQRRADLRMALKVAVESAEQDKQPPEENAYTPRHLSDQQRNNLREQLRQQHLEVKQDQ